VPLGRPIANTQIYLLDSQLQPVPIWAPGEVYIGGASVARGYLGRPELTAEKFIANPFIKDEGGRMKAEKDDFIPHPSSLILYKTGDLARYLPDGNIEFLGRIDHQVKIRGFRIELGEIEALLGQHSAVRKVVALAREDSLGDKRLVAYIVPRPGQPPTSAELRAFLKEKLPEPMLPAAFILLDKLPLTPNGKIDRRALPAPDTIRSELGGVHITPRDGVELQLLSIWEGLLHVRPIGVTDNFFELGGHSLLAVRLMAQIQQRFGQDLPLATLFQGATIEHLASILRQQVMSRPHSPLVEIQAGFSPTETTSIAGGKQRLPFFCVHPADGTVLSYADLAHQLAPDQPFYGLQAPGLDGEQEPYTQLEAMATHYLEAIRSIQAEGPYLLGGWSMGGVVAFEMAQQLQRQGQPVALLVLLDSWTPAALYNPDGTASEDDTKLLGNFLANLRGRFAKELPAPPADLQQLGPDEQLNYFLEHAKLLEFLLPDTGLVQLHRLLQVFKSNVRAMWRYTPQPYPGQITLFQAAQQPDSADGPAPGWSELSSRPIKVYSVPGDHYTMLTKPYVEALAEQLQICLDIAHPVQVK
jgi:thioesterase domain-containing protein